MLKIKYIVFLLAVSMQIRIRADNGGDTRSFTIDYDHDTFLMDGSPFRFISGSFHYFRALPDSWRQILRSMRAAGLNAVMTYIEWSTHEPTEGNYKWDGIADLEQFITLAEEENLYVILRPGPYICAERDMGGFPYWLLTKYPHAKLRTYDTDYLREVTKWYGVLMPRIQKYLYGRGGPVIMVSIENEYGFFSSCDVKYLSFLKNLTESYVQNDAVLFTNDAPDWLQCGTIPDVLATLDFGSTDNPARHWQMLRAYQPKGPLVNAEFYLGWLTHWSEPMARVAIEPLSNTLRLMLAQGANVNFYMFFGGTNFAFTAGANERDSGLIHADITSYDYDAPLDEAGDPTPKYYALRSVILEFFPDPGLPVPQKLPKMKIPPVQLNARGSLLSDAARDILAKYTISAERTLGFEALNQNSGFILYEADIPKELNQDPLALYVNNLHGRAYVHVNNQFVGVLSRDSGIFSLPISLGLGYRLQLLVENEGRINFDIPNDFKGILGSVTLDGNEVLNWTMTGFPLDDYSLIQNYIDRYVNYIAESRELASVRVFHGTFIIDAEEIYDTYVDPTGWGKGLIFINGFNLGRYWPLVGPQVTLYVPRHILLRGSNNIVVIEYQRNVQENATISFTDEPKLDGL
ncbi:beta-galactosidase-like [Topomyia yanbarensis]|uniref:beta-galactosidase-like n=1 Tax=Topomyia yanbarensis TaxID=2498891 RepID=UPI00273BFE4E|nr:beta-galactosidase-like [Topomyia yanbarensis]XP_058821552.1 beta-galactosidase-like [Topomyia yanbarensis]XP_058821553.1 beta-galactosidase-like [Topomyia yanbarensis]XP_058821554.1 beta-galactosidase-like [Topomyia yanbarensis]XP_058821555.1 beta-galactosidase-like [Topomyia yanbarensis]XP_058821556.1 beta-galactosidase-like [Topomyia yanbarensis]XP_058821558.1 beta-galactosidase-like [Topomyia yanbarensis]